MWTSKNPGNPGQAPGPWSSLGWFYTRDIFSQLNPCKITLISEIQITDFSYSVSFYPTAAEDTSLRAALISLLSHALGDLGLVGKDLVQTKACNVKFRGNKMPKSKLWSEKLLSALPEPAGMFFLFPFLFFSPVALHWWTSRSTHSEESGAVLHFAQRAKTSCGPKMRLFPAWLPWMVCVSSGQN